MNFLKKINNYGNNRFNDRDWVYIKEYPSIAQPMQVKKEHFVRSLVEFEPIPLTIEILEKNGFEKNRDYGYFIGQSNSGYYIYLDNNYLSIQAGYDAIEFAWCEYVHELQHALKLCGIKKEIIL